MSWNSLMIPVRSFSESEVFSGNENLTSINFLQIPHCICRSTELRVKQISEKMKTLFTRENLISFAGVEDFRFKLVRVTQVGQRDVVAPIRHRRAELH